eukprot:m.20747 g.20747  ORF g.20747 m.20747 type:complete len:196 (+) comp5282_c0_seq1:128-715(+)
MGRVAKYKKEKKVGVEKRNAPRKNRKRQSNSHGSDSFDVMDIVTSEGDTGEGMIRQLPKTMFRDVDSVDDEMRHMMQQTASIGRILDGDEFVSGKERKRKKKNWMTKKKRSKLKEKEKEMQNSFGNHPVEKSDQVGFGEVAHEPPTFGNKPQSGKRNTTKSSATKPNNEEKEVMEAERLRVIEAYRQMKMRKMRG